MNRKDHPFIKWQEKNGKKLMRHPNPILQNHIFLQMVGFHIAGHIWYWSSVNHRMMVKALTDMGSAVKNHRHTLPRNLLYTGLLLLAHKWYEEYKLALSESLYAFSSSNSRKLSNLDKGTPAFRKMVTTFTQWTRTSSDVLQGVWPCYNQQAFQQLSFSFFLMSQASLPTFMLCWFNMLTYDTS